MVIQPYTENAIWHGLMHKEGDRQLNIRVEQEDKELLLVVRDNGIGRAAAQQHKSKTATKHRSLGMKITSEIIQRNNELASKGVEVIDLKNEHGEALGTEVRIRITIDE